MRIKDYIREFLLIESLGFKIAWLLLFIACCSPGLISLIYLIIRYVQGL